MSVKWIDSNQTMLLTPVSSQGPLEMVTIDMDTSAIQPNITNHVTNQPVMNTSTNYTNATVAGSGTNSGASC